MPKMLRMLRRAMVERSAQALARAQQSMPLFPTNEEPEAADDDAVGAQSGTETDDDEQSVSSGSTTDYDWIMREFSEDIEDGQMPAQPQPQPEQRKRRFSVDSETEIGNGHFDTLQHDESDDEDEQPGDIPAVSEDGEPSESDPEPEEPFDNRAFKRTRVRDPQDIADEERAAELEEHWKMETLNGRGNRELKPLDSLKLLWDLEDYMAWMAAVKAKAREIACERRMDWEAADEFEGEVKKRKRLKRGEFFECMNMKPRQRLDVGSFVIG